VLDVGLNFVLLFTQHSTRVAFIEHFFYTFVRSVSERVGGQNKNRRTAMLDMLSIRTYIRNRGSGGFSRPSAQPGPLNQKKRSP
jgi:hypothetical protein